MDSSARFNINRVGMSLDTASRASRDDTFSYIDNKHDDDDELKGGEFSK